MQNHRQMTKPQLRKKCNLPLPMLTPLVPHSAHRLALYSPVVVKSHPERV